MNEQEFKNSSRLVPARLFASTWSAALLVVGLKGWAFQLPSPWPVVSVVIGALVVIGLLADPFIAVFLKRVVVDDDRISMRVGGISPVERVSPLSRINSVQVDQSWSLRLFRLSNVTMVAQGEEASAFVLEGLTQPDVQRLMMMLEGKVSELDKAHLPKGLHEVTTSQDALREAGPDVDDAFVYRSNGRDLAATALATGAVAVAASATLGLGHNISDLTGWDMASTFSGSLVGSIALVTLLVAVSALLAALRFRGLTIVSRDGASFDVRYGTVGRLSHSISRDQVVAVRLTMTPFDVLLGTRQVTLSTARLRRSSMGDITFPSMREAEAQRLLASIMGQHPTEQRPSARWLIRPFVLVLWCAFCLSQLTWSNPWLSAGAALLIVVIVVTLWKYLTTRVAIAPDRSHLSITHIALSHSVWLYTPACVRVATTRRIRPLSLANLTVVSFAHRRNVVRTVIRPKNTIDELGAFQRQVQDRPWRNQVSKELA